MRADALQFLRPDWPVSKKVHAVVTTRRGGASAGPYASFNLADHTGDDRTRVQQNRALLRDALKLPADPSWLKQVHGARVVDIAAVARGATADGAYAQASGVVCAILTADCLPIFACDRDGGEVALLHAGWRGLAAGVIEEGLQQFRAATRDLIVWLGPAIGAKAYEVGDEVRQAFLVHDREAASAFAPSVSGKWYMDIYQLARRRLAAAGVCSIHGGDYCTATQSDLFFSYRRDGATGRMASLLWLE
jgi:YfiH family protein